MYFILQNDRDYESAVRINDPEGLPVDFDLMSGAAMSTQVVTPLVYTTNASKDDQICDFMDSSFPLMSDRFLELVKKAGVNNLQVYPAVLKSLTDGSVWNNYFGVNILGLVSCADLSRSTYSELMPRHYAFDELAIDVSKIDGAKLFRLAEHTQTIVVHGDICQYIVDNDPDFKLKGWTVGEIIQ